MKYFNADFCALFDDIEIYKTDTIIKCFVYIMLCQICSHQNEIISCFHAILWKNSSAARIDEVQLVPKRIARVGPNKGALCPKHAFWIPIALLFHFPSSAKMDINHRPSYSTNKFYCFWLVFSLFFFWNVLFYIIYAWS
jgi:hypothetical protein